MLRAAELPDMAWRNIAASAVLDTVCRPVV